jgi:hypothetical protein
MGFLLLLNWQGSFLNLLFLWVFRYS